MKKLAGNTASAESPTVARYVPAAVVLCGVQFVDVLGVTVVVTALPRMLADLGAAPADGTAVVTAYAMFFGGLLMVASRVGDRVGHRRTVLAALALFAAASALAAGTPSVWLLVVGRALQGVAAAAAVPSALRLLTTVVPEGPARRRAVAGWSAAGATAGASGFVIGGVLTELASWRSVFWMNIALAGLLAAAIAYTIPVDRPVRTVVPIGWRSSILLVGGTMGIVAGTTLLGEHRPWVLAVAVTGVGVLAAVGFVLVERHARYPLIAAEARQSMRLRWGAVGSFVNTATTSSSITLAAIYLQKELGLTPLRAATLLVTFSILVVPGSLGAPRLIAAWGSGPVLGTGLGAIAAGNTVLTVWPHTIGIGTAAGICGLGIGVGSVAATVLGTTVDDAIKGTAAGVLNTAAQLGTAIGTAVVLLIATTLQPRTAWIVVVILAATAGTVAAVRSPRRRRRSSYQGYLAGDGVK